MLSDGYLNSHHALATHRTPQRHSADVQVPQEVTRNCYFSRKKKKSWITKFYLSKSIIPVFSNSHLLDMVKDPVTTNVLLAANFTWHLCAPVCYYAKESFWKHLFAIIWTQPKVRLVCHFEVKNLLLSSRSSTCSLEPFCRTLRSGPPFFRWGLLGTLLQKFLWAAETDCGAGKVKAIHSTDFSDSWSGQFFHTYGYKFHTDVKSRQYEHKAA